jgi:drug/metabolite transporter (DMT)-like permease
MSSTTGDAGPAGRDARNGLIGTGVAVVVWGLAGIVIKLIDMDPMAIGFWRFLPYSLLIGFWLVARAERPSWRVLRASAAGGICLGLDVILFFTAIKLTNVVNATTIGAMQPIVVAIAASRLFGERIRRTDVIAAGVALCGVVVIVIESAGTPQWSGAGDLAAFGTLFAWSGYFIYSKKSRGVITSTEYSFGTGLWTAVMCLIAGFVFRQDMHFPAVDDWHWFAVLIVGAGILGHTLMNWSLVRVPLWLGSTLTLLIPVIGAVAARVWLDEPLTLIQVAAMLVVVGALTVIVTRQRTDAPAAAVAAEPTL